MHAEDRAGQDRADLQLAPRHLWLRPAHRGAWLEGHAPRRQHPRTTVEVANASGFTADPVQNFFLERYADAYRAELAAFIDAVKAGKACDPTGQDGLMAQRLADAATESAQSGKPVRV